MEFIDSFEDDENWPSSSSSLIVSTIDTSEPIDEIREAFELLFLKDIGC